MAFLGEDDETGSMAFLGASPTSWRCHLSGRCTYIHAYTHASMHAYMHTHMHTYMHAYMHAYMHTHMHAYTHRHTHMMGLENVVHLFLFLVLSSDAGFQNPREENISWLACSSDGVIEHPTGFCRPKSSDISIALMCPPPAPIYRRLTMPHKKTNLASRQALFDVVPPVGIQCVLGARNHDISFNAEAETRHIETKSNSLANTCKEHHHVTCIIRVEFYISWTIMKLNRLASKRRLSIDRFASLGGAAERRRAAGAGPAHAQFCITFWDGLQLP
jgi:hypothetical protein